MANSRFCAAPVIVFVYVPKHYECWSSEMYVCILQSMAFQIWWVTGHWVLWVSRCMCTTPLPILRTWSSSRRDGYTCGARTLHKYGQFTYICTYLHYIQGVGILIDGRSAGWPTCTSRRTSQMVAVSCHWLTCWARW